MTDYTPPPIMPGQPQSEPPTGQPALSPQVIIKPGGLTGATHALHLIVVLLTCGIWLPFYLLILALSPAKRVEVIAPAGTPLAAVEQARAHAMLLSPAEKAAASTRRWIFLGIVVLPPAILLAMWLASSIIY